MLNAFRSSGKKKKGGKLIVWILLGLIIVGLTGFGLGGAVSGLASQNVAHVGDEPVSREDFVRAMLRDLESYARQTGQRPSMAEAQAMGLDNQVLSRLVTIAALDRAARALSLSVNDSIVGEELLKAPAFQGLSGAFDRQAYNFFLERQGLSAKEYEGELRAEVSRLILQASIAGGTEMPETMARTILDYLGERRGFSYVIVTPASQDEALPTPDDAALQAQYDAHPELYTTPETRRVTYAALLPEDLLDQVEVSDEDLQAEYEARSAEYNTPAARVIDVISFPDMGQAEAAKARLDAGELSFVALATERNLSPADISRGRVVAEDLGAAARGLVFGATELGVVGPVETDLGPALYRINAIIAARTVPFAEVEPELRNALALESARRQIGDHIEAAQDLLASGATLEEVAAETELKLGETGVTAQPGEGLAGDAAFRAEAMAAEVGEERDLIDLSGGGIAALRVDAIDAPALKPLDTVRDQVAADWAVAEGQRRLTARAEALQAELGEGRTFDAVAGAAGLELRHEPPHERSDALDGKPADLLSGVFGLAAAGDTLVIGDPAGVYLVQLDAIVPVDPADPAQAARLAQLDAALGEQLGTDLFLGYAQLLTDSAGVEVNRKLIADTLAQYP